MVGRVWRKLVCGKPIQNRRKLGRFLQIPGQGSGRKTVRRFILQVLKLLGVLVFRLFKLSWHKDSSIINML
jgi:hypothetical protein